MWQDWGRLYVCPFPLGGMPVEAMACWQADGPGRAWEL